MWRVVISRFFHLLLGHPARFLQRGRQNPLDLTIDTAELIGSPSLQRLENLGIDS